MEEHQTSSLVKRLEQIVLDNLNNEQFGVEDLSEAYGLSRSQLHKKLKKKNGKSVSQFIREVRLEEAKKLLEQEDVTASEVAYQVGFSSATYFNTRFKDYFGYPPGEVKVRVSYEKTDSVNPSDESLRTAPSRMSNRQKWLLSSLGLVLLVVTGVYFFKKNGNLEKTSKAISHSLLADSISNEKTIAVLPLKNWSGDPDLEYISDGMTDAIINKLAKIEAIDRVVPFTSMTSYKSTDKSIKEIASELKVKNILQGSFQLAGENVNVKLQMIDGNSEKQFWENEYKQIWKNDEIFELQSEVAENVAQHINVSITDSERREMEQILTSNKEAYQYYLDAKYQFSKLTKLGFENGRRLLRSAIELDSSFVEAYTELSFQFIYSGAIWGNMTQKEAWTKARFYLTQAKNIETLTLKQLREIDGTLLTGALFYEYDLSRDTGILETYIGPLYLAYIGDYKPAIELCNTIKTSGGVDELTYWQIIAELSFYQGNEKKCLDIFVSYTQVYNDQYDWLRESAKYYYYLGEYMRSRQALDRLMSLFPDRPPFVLWLNAVLYEVEGEREKSKHFKSLLEKKYSEGLSGSPAWFMALYYCHIKDYDEAFDWLQKSCDAREVEMLWLHSDALLRPVRDDSRYLKLHKAVGFPSQPLKPAAFP